MLHKKTLLGQSLKKGCPTCYQVKGFSAQLFILKRVYLENMKSKKNAMKQQEDFSMDKEKKNEKRKKVILAFSSGQHIRNAKQYENNPKS